MMGAGFSLGAQTCTTQANLSADTRSGIADAATTLAAAVKANEPAKVQAQTIAEYATNFAATNYLIENVAPRLTGDTLEVTQVYALDAKGRRSGDPSDAEFSCALSGSTSETDFSIGALPPGFYAFAMVEARGSEPWLLAFLLRQDSGVWKMAGFYPRARAAAGHDGLWYWKAAREDAAAKALWPAWLFYGEADLLLRPANFVTSTNLDKLRQEEHTATPPELADGISATTPLVLKAADGNEFRYTAINAEGSADGHKLNLSLHFAVDASAPAVDAAGSRARNLAAAKALLDAHKDLRPLFSGVSVFADVAGHGTVATEQSMADIP
jgi:hypothetical protein